MDQHAIAAIAIMLAAVPLTWAVGVLIARHMDRRDQRQIEKERNS